jgi:hypothetical protein
MENFTDYFCEMVKEYKKEYNAAMSLISIVLDIQDTYDVVAKDILINTEYWFKRLSLIGTELSKDTKYYVSWDDTNEIRNINKKIAKQLYRIQDHIDTLEYFTDLDNMLKLSSTEYMSKYKNRFDSLKKLYDAVYEFANIYSSSTSVIDKHMIDTLLNTLENGINNGEINECAFNKISSHIIQKLSISISLILRKY